GDAPAPAAAGLGAHAQRGRGGRPARHRADPVPRRDGGHLPGPRRPGSESRDGQRRAPGGLALCRRAVRPGDRHVPGARRPPLRHSQHPRDRLHPVLGTGGVSGPGGEPAGSCPASQGVHDRGDRGRGRTAPRVGRRPRSGPPLLRPLVVTSRRLVVLDFSGTLSPGATGFAEPETLEAALRSSGLAGLGVTRDIFWDAVAQTWEQASTTGAGYARSMAGAMAERLGVAVGSIIGAARSFTAAYLAASTVATEWETGLRELVSRCRLVVASDHYAEATAHIVSELERLGLEARPVTEPAPGSILVATSADLGSRKQ